MDITGGVRKMETKILTVNPKRLQLLEVNARYMKAEEFNRLVDNVLS